MKVLPIALILISLSVPVKVFSQVSSDQEGYLGIKFKSFSTKYYKGFVEVSKEEFESKLETKPTAYNQYSLGKNLNTTSNIIGIPAGLVFGYTMGTMIAGDKPNGALVAVSGICWGSAIVLDLIGQAKRRNSVKTYNTSDKVVLKVAFNEHGVGFAVRF